MCIPVTVYLFLENRTRPLRRLVPLGMLAIQSYSIVICMCRAPWYSCLIALFVMQLFDKRFRKLFIAIALVAAVLVGLTWGMVTESNVAARLNDDVSTYEGRQDRWITAWRMWLVRPIRGWGFGRFELESWRFRPKGTTQARIYAPENDYLVVLVGSGLLGLLPYLGVLLLPLWQGLRLIYKAKSFQRRGLPWPGFVKVETLAVACAVIICFGVFSFSSANVIASTKLILLSLAGAVIGSHDHLLRNSSDRGKVAVESLAG
jgi:O-antigen ligase